MISYNKENLQPRFKDIEVLSFDAGFTLLEPNPSFGGILAAEEGFACNASELEAQFVQAHHELVHYLNRRGEKGIYSCQKHSHHWWNAITIQAYGSFIPIKKRVTLANKCYHKFAKSNAQVNTIRNKLLKIGARITCSLRHIVLHLAGGYPFKELFACVLARLRSQIPVAASG